MWVPTHPCQPVAKKFSGELETDRSFSVIRKVSDSGSTSLKEVNVPDLDSNPEEP